MPTTPKTWARQVKPDDSSKGGKLHTTEEAITYGGQNIEPICIGFAFDIDQDKKKLIEQLKCLKQVHSQRSLGHFVP